MAGRVLVVGSLNMDVVVRCERAPERGETLLGRSVSFVTGGKGANQAIAAARLGSEVVMCGRVGNDEFGRALRASLVAAGVNADHVRTGAAASGTGFVFVEASGDNRIVVVPGANGEVTFADAQPLLETAGDTRLAGDQVLLQLEVPMAGVRAVAAAARKAGARVLLNAAPADLGARSLAAAVDHLVVNESEAAALCEWSIDSPAAERAAVQTLVEAGFGAVTLTLGERGALHRDRDGWIEVAAPKMNVVDTTAAGDAFVGGFAAEWSRGASSRDALAFAVAAGSLAVTRPGAQPSLPSLAETRALAKSLHPRSL